ncbi:hypothetical protein GCM10018963_07370 [Saccharothrix longispora]
MVASRADDLRVEVLRGAGASVRGAVQEHFERAADVDWVEAGYLSGASVVTEMADY